MQRLEVSGAVRLIYKSLGVKGLNKTRHSAVSYRIKVILYYAKQDLLDMGPVEGNWIDLAQGSNKW